MRMSYCVIRKEEEKKKVTRKEYEKMAVKSKKKNKAKTSKKNPLVLYYLWGNLRAPTTYTHKGHHHVIICWEQQPPQRVCRGAATGAPRLLSLRILRLSLLLRPRVITGGKD